MVPDDFSGALIQCVLSIYLVMQLAVVTGLSKFQSLQFWDKYPESTNVVPKSSFTVVAIYKRCDLKRSYSFKFKNCLNFFFFSVKVKETTYNFLIVLFVKTEYLQLDMDSAWSWILDTLFGQLYFKMLRFSGLF